MIAWAKSSLRLDGYDVLWSDNDFLQFLSNTQFHLTKELYVRTWMRTEWFVPVGEGATAMRSALTLIEVDCSQERVRNLSMKAYVGLNLQGEAVDVPFDDNDTKWFYVSPNSRAEQQTKNICPKLSSAVAAAKAEAEQPKSNVRNGVWTNGGAH